MVKSRLAEITLDTKEARTLLMRIDSGEVRITGLPNTTRAVLSFGYFRAGEQILSEESMRPDFGVQDTNIVLRQTPEQIERARSSGAVIRLALETPDAMSISES